MGDFPQKRWYLNKDIKMSWGEALQTSGRSTFQAKGSSDAKDVGWEHVCCVQGNPRRARGAGAEWGRGRVGGDAVTEALGTGPVGLVETLAFILREMGATFSPLDSFLGV